MKTFICLFFVLVSGYAFGQAELGPHEWDVTLKVVDDNGQPVEGAKTWVAYDNPKDGGSTDPFQSNDWAIAGLTDVNGVFTASHTDRTWSLGIHAQKTGYYPVNLNYQLYVPGQMDPQTVAANRNATLTLVLKKIGKPIPMYARWLDKTPPVLNRPVGYDLTAGDWVAPYGKGQTTDIIFTKEFYKNAQNDYDDKLTVSFPNTGDGIQEFTVQDAEKSSGLRSPHEAPADGYQPQLTKETYAHPGRPSKFDYDENRIYLFRVRTALDENGNVKSALYGKIYGDFMQIRYYLNPIPNDRNIEFDPKHNLLKGLKSFEQVTAP